MAYTFGQGSALSPRVDFNMESSIYKGLAMGAQANKSKTDALAKRIKDAKLTPLQPGKIHPFFQEEANDLIAKGTAEMMIASQSGQDPTPIHNVYSQRMKNLSEQGEILNQYMQRADDKHYVDRDVVSSIMTGDKEGYKKALEKYPEEERGLYDPFRSPLPLVKIDIASDLAKTINLDNDYDSFERGKTTKIPGTNDFRIEMNLSPKAKRDYAIRYLQNEDVQYNIVSGQYKNLYKAEKDKLIKAGVKSEDADGEAMVKVVESMMPSYSDKASAPSGTTVNNYIGGPEDQLSTPLETVTIKPKMSFTLSNGKTISNQVDLTTGKYFTLPIGKETSIPASVMRPLDGRTIDDSKVIDIKQGGLTSIPIVARKSKITFYDKDSGNNIVLKAGDAIPDNLLQKLKTDHPDLLNSVTYQPVTIYTYETKSGTTVSERHGFIPASGSNLSTNQGVSKPDNQYSSKIYNQVKSEVDMMNAELKKLYKPKQVAKPAQGSKLSKAENKLIPQGTKIR
jgi:hypothetical protein